MQRDLEVLRYDGPAFHCVMSFEGWRVGILNYDPAKYAPETANNLERHRLTDELFGLMQGRCILYTAGSGDEPGNPAPIVMEADTLYNIRRDVWHTLVGSEDMKLMIVENANTSKGNTQYHRVDDDLIAGKEDGLRC